jgi:putative ABC transport system substrate-binding protein
VAAATELAQLPVDVIVTFGSPATQAAKQATTTIPIVMVWIGDPVRAGFVASLAHPGGNITGNTILGPEVAAKRLQLFKLAVPTMSRVAFLWNPDNPSHAPYLDKWKAAAPALGVEMLFVAVRSSDEFDSAFAAMIRERPDAFTMTADLLHQLHIGWIIDFLARNRLPGMYQVRENVVAGGLMSYGASFADLSRHAAGYVHKILQGTRPADLPVEQPTKFDLTVNLKTAKSLGLTIPESFLLLADEVIE